MTEDDPFVVAGREQGDIIAAYLIGRMKEGKLSPAEAVNIVAAQIEQQAESMVAAGSEPNQVQDWLTGLRKAVSTRNGFHGVVKSRRREPRLVLNPGPFNWRVRDSNAAFITNTSVETRVLRPRQPRARAFLAENAVNLYLRDNPLR